MTTSINLQHLWHEMSLLPADKLPYLQIVVEKLRTQNLPKDTEQVDWDELLQDVYARRQANNRQILENLENLAF